MKISSPTHSVDLETNVHLQEIDRNIYRMLESRTFLPFIEQRLRQFGLNSYNDGMDVVLKARDIALEKIISGEIVENFDAWFIKICLNIIRNVDKKT